MTNPTVDIPSYRRGEGAAAGGRATPGADIIEVGEDGARRTTWDQLEMVDHWRRYLSDPDKYLRHLIGS